MGKICAPPDSPCLCPLLPGDLPRFQERQNSGSQWNSNVKGFFSGCQVHCCWSGSLHSLSRDTLILRCHLGRERSAGNIGLVGLALGRTSCGMWIPNPVFQSIFPCSFCCSHWYRGVLYFVIWENNPGPLCIYPSQVGASLPPLSVLSSAYSCPVARSSSASVCVTLAVSQPSFEPYFLTSTPLDPQGDCI